MLKDELALLDPQLEAEASEVQVQLPRGIRPEIIAQWEETNRCFLTEETVEIYLWHNGLPSLLDSCFVHFHTLVRFDVAIEDDETKYLRLCSLYEKFGIVERGEVVRFIRPLLHFEDEEAAIDGHIYIPCTQTRVHRLPLISDICRFEPYHFYADSWETLVRFARIRNARGWNSTPTGLQKNHLLWEEENPMCAVWNREVWSGA